VPETEFSTTTRLPVAAVWDFVKDMDNWAPFLTGYQSHERRGERDSLWTIQGDTGVLARVVRFEVRVTEWSEARRVAFALEGINEPMRGEGSFSLEAAGAAGEGAGPAPAGAPRPGAFARLLEALARWLLRLVGGGTRRDPAAAAAASGGSRMRFRLRVEAGGPMAPMVNALIKPALGPVAEDLASKIVAHLESPPPAARP
jgi:carbon monoxide dehydrogenase subunit G